MSNKGEVTYEVRADYSNVENDLDQANQLVEKKASTGMEKLKSVAGGTAKAIGALTLQSLHPEKFNLFFIYSQV